MAYKYKYKVGDAVTIRKDLECYGMYGKSMATNFMMYYLGKQAIITARGNGLYHIDIDKGCEVWTEEMFLSENDGQSPKKRKESVSRKDIDIVIASLKELAEDAEKKKNENVKSCEKYQLYQGQSYAYQTAIQIIEKEIRA